MLNTLSRGIISEKAFIGLHFVNHRGEFKEIIDFEVRNDRYTLFRINGVYYQDFELDFYRKENEEYVLIGEKEEFTHKYTVVVGDINVDGPMINFTREHVFYKTRKLSKEEQHNLIYDIDLEVDAPSYMGEDFEVVSFEVYEETL